MEELKEVGADAVAFFEELIGGDEATLPLAAMHTLLRVIERSDATTMMRLQRELGAAKDAVWAAFSEVTPRTLELLGRQTPISLSSGLELFQRYVTRVNDDYEAQAFAKLESTDFAKAKAQLEQNGIKFLQDMAASREVISALGAPFVPEGATILTHGGSRVVAALLARARENGRKFTVLVTESQPLRSGYEMAAALEEADIPVTVIPDSGVAFFMERVDLVVVGAEAVVESGGIVNRLGTASIAVNAKALSKPFCVAAESFKFARLYPLSQSDLPAYCTFPICAPVAEGAAAEKAPSSPACDYTSGEFITLLFTDVGVRTPAAISDELISFYQ